MMAGTRPHGGDETAEPARAATDRRWVVVFRLGDERFAIDADAVEHALERPGVRPLPALPRHIAGVVRDGGRWIAAVDPAGALELPAARRRGSALVLRRGRVRYALLVDAVLAARAMDPDRLRSLSDVGADASAGAADAGVVAAEGTRVFEDEHGLVTLFRPDELFSAGIPPGWEDDGMQQDENAAAPVAVVAFRLGGDTFGVEVSRVQHALRYREPTAAPAAPEFVEGTIEVQGRAVPVVDLRERLDAEPTPPGEATRILIVSVGDEGVGFIVDAVSDVLHLDPGAVAPAPAYVRGLAGEYLDGVARNGEELLLLLRPEAVLSEDERDALRSFGEARNGA